MERYPSLAAETKIEIVGFATQGSGGDDENRLKELLSGVAAQIYPFDRGRKLRNIWRIARLMRRERPSAVVMEGTGIAGGLGLLLGNLLSQVPYIVSSGDAVGPFISSHYRFLGVLFQFYEKLLYRRAIGFIGWSPYLTGRALTYGTRFGMTAAGWSPYPLNEHERRQARQRMREHLGIPKEQIVVGIVGSLNWNSKAGYCYGYELVMALRELERKDITALIVGDGSGKDRLAKLAEGHDNIMLVGRVPREEVSAYLSAMDLASLPQSVDQVGSFRYTTKISEYMAMGLPIVTGKLPMAYDLGDGMIRLDGLKPWERRYIESMRGLLRRLEPEDLIRWQDEVPRELPAFNRGRQVQMTSEFIHDILSEQRRSERERGSAYASEPSIGG
ncbi:glycosyltransferase [Cohnella sp. AR92]|uniref:glycosyltransferase n=1 Tax=Cohnella sp. AR92 TaxID=648716 RepID=UPI000F8DE1EF|nr:glycosyltransferase [Cohnella sp. AR92]RUS45266.1 glycosyltransferase [Cohnella sp. AR92]